jgi:hypothetical protein
MKSNEPKPAQPLRDLLAGAQPKLRYDVESGLARHERLVGAGAVAPAWASSMPHVARALKPSASLPWFWSVLSVTCVSAVFWLTHAPEAPTSLPKIEARGAAHEENQETSAGEAPQVERLVAQTSSSQRSAADLQQAARVDTHARTAPRSIPPLAKRLPVSANIKARPHVSAAARPAESAPSVASANSEEPEHSSDADAVTPATTAQSPLTTAPQVRSTAPEAIDPEVLAEMRELALAERLLASEPRRSLTIVRAGMERFARGYLTQERRYVEIMALLALQKPKDAALLSQAFLRDYPKGPYRRKVERALAQER